VRDGRMEVAVGTPRRCFLRVGESGSEKAEEEDSSSARSLELFGLNFVARFLLVGLAVGGKAFSLALPLDLGAASGVGDAMVMSGAALVLRLRGVGGSGVLPAGGSLFLLLGPESESEGLSDPCFRSSPFFFLFSWQGKQMTQLHPGHLSM